MSQLNIGMKKNPNKKLVINIALKKEGFASRSVEAADEDLGSSRDEKQRFKSSERQRVAEEIDGVDDHSTSFRDGVMREVDVGKGLSGALNLLRDQGTFKKNRKLVGVTLTQNHGDDISKDAFKEIRIDRVDEYGRILTMKEAFRSLCHGFHGKKPGKRKQEKRKRKHEDQSKQMESLDRAVERMRQVHTQFKTPYILL